MNALGVDYASSSDDEDSPTLPQQQQQPVVAAAGAAPVVVVTANRTSSSSSDAIEIDGLPSEPPGAADPDVQARIARLLALQEGQGGHVTQRSMSQIKTFQENLQTKKEVANPYILGKVVEYFGIDELQTNFASDVFDPYALPLHEYSEKLSIEQKKRPDERLATQQQRSQIAFTHSQSTD